MTQEKKYTRVGKYHYDTITICRETDVLMTRCYKCGQFKPSGTANFKKSKQYERGFAPLCKDCYNKEQLKWKENQAIHTEKVVSEIKPENVKAESLFQPEDTVESKLDRILSYLGLNKGAYKKS